MKIYCKNFWRGFSIEHGLIRHLMERSIGPFKLAPTEHDADIVLTSVFGDEPPRFPDKSICVIWENVRPNYALYRYSLSSDFDSYGGRNCRLPFWYEGLAWTGMTDLRVAPAGSNHHQEPLIDIDALVLPRTLTITGRERFCCFVAGNSELHRIHAVDALSQLGSVDVYGAIADRPVRASKFELLKRYRFNICFENSIYPGYYTEKAVHAWISGCVPLYYADPWYRSDFNPRALVNRIDFATLEDFVKHVAAIEASKDAQAEIVSQPLLLKPPALEPVINFVRRACEEINDRNGGRSVRPR